MYDLCFSFYLQFFLDMNRYKQVFIILGIFVVILKMVRRHTEINVNNAEREDRSESYQYNEESSYKLPTPI